MRAAEIIMAQAQVEAERFWQTPGLRGKVMRWLVQHRRLVGANNIGINGAAPQR